MTDFISMTKPSNRGDGSDDIVTIRPRCIMMMSSRFDHRTSRSLTQLYLGDALNVVVEVFETALDIEAAIATMKAED